jgi:DMSO/TMAO reductase YedYZ molybdopterin-dependent catalytic subunit
MIVRPKIDPSRWWRSPIRGPWLTSIFGAALLVGIPIEFVTGLVSYAAYNPRLRGNNPNSHTGILHFYLFTWVSGPPWLYRLTQGVHITLGLALVPVVLAKLWSVIPRLFVLPPFRTIAQVLERISLIFLVGGIVFEMVTGILNIDYDYSFKFSFYDGHFLGAWMFIGGFVVHVSLKLPKMITALRGRSFAREMRTPLAHTVPEGADEDGLVAATPQAPTMSRRGALALVGTASAAVVVMTVGQTVGGKARAVALLAPRGRSYGSGPNDFQVNKTAATARISSAAAGPAWRLQVVGFRNLNLSRQDLLAMPLRTERLPIACVEGWSTVQRWTGVRLIDLAALVGVTEVAAAVVESIERGSPYAKVTLSGDQVRASRSLLALQVNGVDLSPDHGYPARTIIPAAPGVHNTKWVRQITYIPS